MSEWFDGAFWSDCEGVMFDERRMEMAREEVAAAAALLSLPANSRVLDIPCGPGRHAAEFARLGHRVTGVDLHAPYLEQASAVADAEKLTVDYVESDMRHFSAPESFDVAVNLYNSFGYFEDPADDLAVLAHVRQSLVPGGRLLIDMISKELVARSFRERTWMDRPDGSRLIERKTIRDGWSWTQVDWTILAANGEVREHSFGHRLYAASEMVRICSETGFGACAVYGHFDGRPFDHNARRMIVVATR